MRCYSRCASSPKPGRAQQWCDSGTAMTFGWRWQPMSPKRVCGRRTLTSACRFAPRRLDAVTWDLAFPEVFPIGFSVVLGNPPWDVVLPNTKDFVADYDPSHPGSTHPVATRGDRERRCWLGLASQPYLQHIAKDSSGRNESPAVYTDHQAPAPAAARPPATWICSAYLPNATIELTAADGTIGVLMPSAFHANEGTTGVRRLYLHSTNLNWCCRSKTGGGFSTSTAALSST